MKVLINTESLNPPLTGIGNYTFNLIEQLQQCEIKKIQCFSGTTYRSPEDALSACVSASENYINNKPQPAIHHEPRVRNFLRGVPFAYRLREYLRNRQLKRHEQELRSYVYHEPNFILKAHAGPCVATVHDLSFIHYPQFHPKARVDWMTSQLPATLKQADYIITVSNLVRQELISDFGMPEDRVRAIYLGAPEGYAPLDAQQTASVMQRHGLRHGEYVLFVGSLEPRKGIDLLLEAWSRLPEALYKAFPLVLAGAPGWNNEAIKQRIATLSATHGLRHLSFVPAQELPLLYAGAATFAYPSHYEGFGLPVLEAMQSGVPVICTQGTSMTEFAGDSVVGVEKNNIEHLRDELQKLLESATLRAEFAQRGLAKAQEFSWRRCAQETLEVYRTIER